MKLLNFSNQVQRRINSLMHGRKIVYQKRTNCIFSSVLIGLVFVYSRNAASNQLNKQYQQAFYCARFHKVNTSEDVNRFICYGSSYPLKRVFGIFLFLLSPIIFNFSQTLDKNIMRIYA